MAHIKNHYVKFVFFLFCLSQVQAGPKQLLDISDNPFNELFREMYKSVQTISEKLKERLSEDNINIDEYIYQIKYKFHESQRPVLETIEKVQDGLIKFSNEICDTIQSNYDRGIEELKAKDPEIAKKIKELKTEFAELKEEIPKFIVEIKKPYVDKLISLKEDVFTKTKPLAKRFVPVVKDLEFIILTIIADSRKSTKKN